MLRKTFDNVPTALAAFVAVHAAECGDKRTDKPTPDDADCRGGPAAEAIAFELFAAGGVGEIAGQCGVEANAHRPPKEKRAGGIESFPPAQLLGKAILFIGD